MPRHHRRGGMDAEMSGSGIMENPAMPAVQAGHQEALKMSHVKINENYMGIDPSCDFDSSTISRELRAYPSDQAVTNVLAPISFSSQPQFNIFRSLSESFFVFQVNLTGTVHSSGGVASTTTVYAPKPYFSSLFITDLTTNLNNVNCSDVHSSTCHYSHFIKTILFESNLKSPGASVVEATNVSGGAGTTPAPFNTYGLSGDDTKTLTQGIINTDWLNGLTTLQSVHGIFMSCIDGSEDNVNFTNNASAIEITYRPKDGVWLSPKLLPPGILENFVLRLNSANNIFQAGNSSPTFGTTTANAISQYTWNDFSIASNSNVAMNILSAKYYEFQYIPTQSLLRSYQSIIAMQPIYIPNVSANTFLTPIPAGASSVSIQNCLAGRLPNLIVIGAINNNPNSYQNNVSTVPPANAVAHQFKTYSPILAKDTLPSQATCLSSVRLTVNGRLYPLLYSVNCAIDSNQDLTVLYEQYKQGCLIRDCAGRGDGQQNQTVNWQYKMDNPLLSFGEFKSNFTYWVFNISRNGQLPTQSGSKEVGGVDILATFDTSRYSPSGNSQLLVCAIQQDSLLSITDGGSTCSYVY